MSILDDIGTALDAASVTGGVTGWTLYKSYLPDSPDLAIAVFETGGPTPDQTQGDKFDEPSFQVRGRGEAFGYDALRTKMQEVFDALNDATVSGYTFIFADSSGPIPMGYDKNDRPELSWNFSTMKAR